MKPDQASDIVQLSPSANPAASLSKQKRKRVWLTDSEKYSILEWMDANNANQKQTFLRFGIGRSTMSDLVKEKRRLYEMAASGSLSGRKRMKNRPPACQLPAHTLSRRNVAIHVNHAPASSVSTAGRVPYKAPIKLIKRSAAGYYSAVWPQSASSEKALSFGQDGEACSSNNGSSTSLLSYNDTFEEDYSVEFKPDRLQLDSIDHPSASKDIATSSENVMPAITIEEEHEVKREVMDALPAENIVQLEKTDENSAVTLEESMTMIERLQRSVEVNVSDIRTSVELSALLSAVKEKFEKVMAPMRK